MNQAKRENFFSGSKFEPLIGYCRCVKIGPHIWVSGTTAFGENGEIVCVGGTSDFNLHDDQDAYGQSIQIWKNIENALKKSGASLKDVVRTRMFVVDIEKNSDLVAKAHYEVFKEIFPTASMIGVEKFISKEMLVEFEVDAYVTDHSENKST